MTKLTGETLNVKEENIKKIKELFPAVDTDGKIDFDKLKQILGDYAEDSDERYNFTWNGKGEALRISQTPSMGTLRPVVEESKNWDETENLYIEGDNLEVLKLLQKSYFNKIKMIYIDPPYNTGNDFVYKDNYKDNIKNYKKITGQADKKGRMITTNYEYSGRYHTDWLNMMYPRLRLARNLLTEDGVIFISIDENEVHNLRKICDEIFGEDNFMTQMTIKLRHENRILKGDKDFHEVCEYTLVYRKSKDYKQTKIIEDNTSIEKYVYEIELKGAPIEIIELDNKKVEVYPPERYEVIKHSTPSLDYVQRISIRGSLKDGNSSGRFFMKHLDAVEQKYGYLYKVPNMGNDKFDHRFFMRQPTENHLNGIYFQGVPLDKSDTKLVPYPNFLDYVDIFNTVGYEGNVPFRNGKKPIKYIKHLMTLAGIEAEKDCIVLDFFSGSATTAHALMEMNSENNSNNKFIMVQLPESTEDNDEANKEGYDNICQIGRQRIRNAGEQITKENKEIGVSHLEDLDIGFKTFKLDSSNIKEWNPGRYDDVQLAIEDSLTPYVEGRTEEDVVYEMILKMGLDLTYSVEEYEVNGKTIYSVGYGFLMISLADDINLGIAEKMIEIKDSHQPEEFRVIFRDEGFKNDTDKTNIKETLRSAGLAEEAFITL